jgi:UDP-4-amino-4,6-dideoxy-N-acetyl-beta-L-altrosamine transaminase
LKLCKNGLKLTEIELEKSKFIPYGRQDVTEEDIKAVVKILRSDYLTQGPAVPVFEQKLCDYTGAKYAVAVNSCTAALHIACLALDLSPGDILWTSPITFVASANCAFYCGASVDFVDIELETGLMNVTKLKEKLELAKKEGKLPKIVIPVHFAGQPCDMEQVHTLSQKYGFSIIEDAAHAIGARYQDEPVGNCRFSDITVFSFHPVKIITTGEGGVAMTNNPLYAEKMRLLRSHGIIRDLSKMRTKINSPWYYEQTELGFNYRMTDIQAALGLSQIDRLDEYIVARRKIASWYNDKFDNTNIETLVQKIDRLSSYHLYVIQVNSSIREKLYTSLRGKGVGVQIHYIPVYKHPFYKLDKTLPVTEEYYQRTLTLPLFPLMKLDEMKKVVHDVMDFMQKHS